jgi:hypothetical protein
MTLKLEMAMTCNGQTWTESHYYLLDGSLPIDPTPFTALALARGDCLGTGATLTGYTISYVPGNRVTQDDFGFAQNNVGTWPADPSGFLYAASVPDNALLITINGQSLPSGSPPVFSPTPPLKRLYMAGVPAKVITTSDNNAKDIQYDAPFFNALGLYMKVLTGNQNPNTLANAPQNTWGYRIKTPAQSVQAQPPVTNVNFPNSVGIVTQNALPNIGFNSTAFPGTNTQVVLSGWRRENTRLSPLNGEWTVIGILPPAAPATSPYTYFLYHSGNVPVDNYVKPGKIAPLTFQYVPYSAFWSPDKYARRKRGERFGARVGRSPVGR